MKRSTSMTTSLMAVTLLLMTSAGAGLRVIDLTYQLKQGESISYPIYPEYNFTILNRGVGVIPILPNTWIEDNKIEMAEDTGTNMDAPSHFNGPSNWRMHQVPPSRLVGPGVVVDITQEVNRNADYAITARDLLRWEYTHGRIPDGAVVLMRSGWGSRYPDKKRVFNTENPSDLSSHRFPGFSEGAARWLATRRNITALGGDTPSPDVGQNGLKFPVHHTLLRNNIILLESVANLEKMPETGTLVVIGALNLYDGAGSPIRLLALSDLESHFRDTRKSCWLCWNLDFLEF